MFWRGVIGYLPVNVVQGVAGLLTIVVFTRLLTPEEFGAYAMAFTVVAIVHTALFTWLEAAMARFQQAEARSGSTADHFATIYKTWRLLAASMLLIAAPVLWFWPMAIPLKLAIATGLAGTLVKGLGKLAQEHRRAAGRVGEVAIMEMVISAGGFAAGAALALLGLGGAAPLVGIAMATALCLVFVLPSELSVGKGGHYQPARARSYAAYGIPLSVSLIMALVLSGTDRLLIGAFLSEADVGVYHAGYSLANRTLDVAFIWLGSAAGPAAVAALEHGGLPALDRTAKEQSSFMVLLTLPAAVGLALVAEPLSDVLIGEALRDGAAQVTPWIALSGLMAGWTTYYFHTAFTLGKATKRLLIAMAIPALANVVLNLALIPIFGVMGAVYATAISYALGLVASILIGRRSIALPIPLDTLWRAAIACAAMAGAVLLIPAFGGILELTAKAALGGIVYGAVAFALDAGGARTHSRRLLGALSGRMAKA